MAEHRLFVDAQLHVPGYVRAADPGNVGPNKLWVDTSLGTGKWVLKIRNDADSAWEIVNVFIPAITVTSLFILNGTTGLIQEWRCRNNIDGDPELYAV